ncbi:MAG: phosphotransferase family protein [Streptosporangiaceae bacterium]
MAGRSPAHGFCDDEQTRQLLRSRPPRQALAWAGAGLGGPVTSARALRGGMSSAVHLVTVRRPDGERAQAVLRRYVRPDPDEPDPAAREARALRLAGPAGVPTPALLAVDPDGTQAGVPALLMSRLRGRVDWWPSDLDRWLERLAALLPRIHGTALPPGEAVPRFAPYRQENYRPPGWARYPRVWERAVEISRGPAPDLPAVLLHRDFHPGNVLWRYGRVSGVVDWLGACSGPAPADVAHCRINLLTMGAEVVSRFTVRWERVAGAAYHPWGDVVTIVGFLDDLHDDWGSERLLVENMLARAIAELAG